MADVDQLRQRVAALQRQLEAKAREATNRVRSDSTSSNSRHLVLASSASLPELPRSNPSAIDIVYETDDDSDEPQKKRVKSTRSTARRRSIMFADSPSPSHSPSSPSSPHSSDVSFESTPLLTTSSPSDGSIPLPPSGSLKIIPPPLWESLYPFQRQGVQFAVDRKGRIMVADEMGLGKTVTAIAICAHYQNDWPVLIICPSSVRLNWQAEFKRWLPELITSGRSKFTPLGSFSSVRVLLNGNANLKPLRKVTIISYDLVERFHQQLLDANFGVVICDESHYLKSPTAKRTLLVMPLLKKTTRLLLLTGTPALSRPSELFTQLHAIKPSMFPSMQTFTRRYCDNSQHLPELHGRICDVMLRRLKCEVLSLPPKSRRVTYVSAKSIISGAKVKKWLRSTLRASNETELPNDVNHDLQSHTGVSATHDLASSHDGAVQGHKDPSLPDTGQASESTPEMQEEGPGVGQEENPRLVQLYQRSGLAKLDAVRKYVKRLIISSPKKTKFLLFAHHAAVLDGLQSVVRACAVEMIRIDGSVASEERHNLVTRFQTEERCRIALLSITAGGQGITLTAASHVIFAELYWNPGHLIQAEDRAHRIGQHQAVQIHYLLGRNTLDDFIWPLLSAKLEVVGQALNGLTGQTYDATIKAEGDSDDGGVDRAEEVADGGGDSGPSLFGSLTSDARRQRANDKVKDRQRLHWTD